MKLYHQTKFLFSVASSIVCFVLAFFIIIQNSNSFKNEQEEEGHALDAFNWWYGQRENSDGMIASQSLLKAHRYASSKMKREETKRQPNGKTVQWESIGPNNVGGRILSLAIDPSNTNILWAGSASGGLWKSTTKGIGADAWEYVNTGFPTISISAITIDPANPNVMYIGTGEISYYHFPLIGTPGARASYGMGILKSTDAGATWNTTPLTFTFSQITAIQKIVLNPLNTNTVYVATSEGVYKSADAGQTWSVSNSVVMTMDLVMSPSDTSLLISSHGNLNSSPNPGMYRTTDAGATWTLITNYSPTFSDFGRTALAFSPSNPQIVYAGISSGSTRTLLGLYKSSDSGISWTKVSSTNYVGSQGWYNNVVAVNPQDENVVYCSGIDLYESISGGANLTRKTDWTHGYMYYIAPGGIEGDSLYAHADHHAIAIDPTDPNIIYAGTDGGVFQSTDGGETFSGRNGGLVTTQFYPGFANSFLNENIAFGGLQDNGVLKYLGTTAWNKVDGGDGGWCAVDPRSDNIVFDEYVYLTISKSTNGGLTFRSISASLPTGSSNANFIAPFVISPSNPDILYAGTKVVYKTTNGGDSWFATNGGNWFNGTQVSAIGVSWLSSDTLMASTGTGSYNSSPFFQIFVSTNGGQNWSNVTGSLPNRYPTDIHFDYSNSKTVFLTYSGYGTSHVFKTTNLGQTWLNLTSNLPDVPTQSIVTDPENPEDIFVGTDLGIYHSSDGGEFWNDFNAGMPLTMITDVTISNITGILRASTFGNGLYQRSLPRVPVLNLKYPKNGETLIAGKEYQIKWTQRYCSNVDIEYSSNNGTDWQTIASNLPANTDSLSWTVPFDSTETAKLRFIHLSDSSVIDSTQYFSIIIAPHVLSDWNLVSLHLSVNDASKLNLFPTALSEAYRFEQGYKISDTLYNGFGYWLKFEKPQHVFIAGDSIFTDTVQVNARWNIIGSLSVPISVNQITESVSGLTTSAIFGYEDGYYITDTIKPMHGYWVKALQAGELILSQSNIVFPKSLSVKEQLEQLNSLTFEDARGKKQTLYFGTTSSKFNSNQFEMPPTPPGGAFDVRYSTNKFVTLFDKTHPAEIPIHISSEHYPIKVSSKIIDASQNISVVIDGSKTQLTSITNVQIVNRQSSISIINTTSPDLPKQVVLNQNYPNPFNPLTIINYQLSIHNYVTLKVYDILGKEIATLVDGKQEAGSHSIKFDAKNLASGIYLYKLTVGSFTETRRMIVLK
ncbi:MAG: T9SS type A sorting domain-containing protein [Ignavibacteriae bacterium]|nr:T9SS type A sorting domain-containing protein [Ignavibacteriota bacterium]